MYLYHIEPTWKFPETIVLESVNREGGLLAVTVIFCDKNIWTRLKLEWTSLDSSSLKVTYQTRSSGICCRSPKTNPCEMLKLEAWRNENRKTL